MGSVSTLTAARLDSLYRSEGFGGKQTMRATRSGNYAVSWRTSASDGRLRAIRWVGTAVSRASVSGFSGSARGLVADPISVSGVRFGHEAAARPGSDYSTRPKRCGRVRSGRWRPRDPHPCPTSLSSCGDASRSGVTTRGKPRDTTTPRMRLPDGGKLQTEMVCPAERGHGVSTNLKCSYAGGTSVA
jgi:hypothetical protein